MTLSALESQMTEAVEKLSESVVSMSTLRYGEDFRFGLVPVQGQGSGVIISKRGYIITNNHVVDYAERVRVVLKDGRTFIGEVIGGDTATDTALVRVESDDLPAAVLGDSDKLKVGQMAIAIGNALGLPGGPTVSAGVISALGRLLPGADFIFEGLIQTDASINPGNSGGPLADLNGNVVGINTAMIPYAQGVGFAIPINTVKRIVEQILAEGRVARPWLGISGITLNPAIARRYGLSSDSGVLVAEVVPGSPSYEAGLRGGDVLVQLGPYSIGKMTDLLAAVSRTALGEVMSVSVIRAGTTYRTSLRLIEAPLRAVGMG